MIWITKIQAKAQGKMELIVSNERKRPNNFMVIKWLLMKTSWYGQHLMLKFILNTKNYLITHRI
jgi:hypothetical protein